MYKFNKFFPPQTEPCSVIRLSDNASIPRDIGNVDYQEYLRWVEEGGVTQPPDNETLPPPEPLTPEQKLAQAGLTIEELKTLLGLN